MFNKASVAAICLLVGFAIISPAAAGSIELTAFNAANDSAKGEPGFSRPLKLQLAAQSSACKKCDDALGKCEKKPPYGNPRICASDYYSCIKGKKCE
jgi:hypothetical protein